MTAEERQKLKDLQERLDRFELHGDVGRMVFLAVENAADERDPTAAARGQAARRRRSRLGRLREAVLRIWRRS